MEKLSLEVKQRYRNEDGSIVIIQSISVEILATGEIETVLVVTVDDEFYWLRLPVATPTIRTWRRA